MHSTSNLEDGYKGSGVKLGRSLNKYGNENHTFEILEFLDDRESLKKREAEIVNEELIQDPLCMNLSLGGYGGPGSKFLSKSQLSKGGKSSMSILWNDEKFVKDHKERTTIRNIKLHKEGILNPPTFKGHSHSDESKKKMSESSKGLGTKEKNSQFGTCWITNGIENKKIKKDEQIPNGWKLGRKLNN
jgi:hypothetical protein